MRVAVIDMETDDLYDEVTKMHCFCAEVYEVGEHNYLIYSIVITTKEQLEQFFITEALENTIIVGHNIIIFDIPVIKKLYGLVYQGVVWDSLAMSWKLYPEQEEHGLEYYGRKYKVPKPFVDNWNSSPNSVYINRCLTDVKINAILFGEMYSYFQAIYYPESPFKDINYCTWKLECASEQLLNPLTIDTVALRENYLLIKEEFEQRWNNLKSSMPPVVVYKVKKKPANILKKDGTLSAKGSEWYDFLVEYGYAPTTTETEIKYASETKEPNPQSNSQLKNWLYSLGWIPTIYVYRKNTKGELNKVPQLQDADKNLCPNIEVLIERYPELESLEGFFMIKHRKEIMESFEANLVDGNKIRAEIGGFTNTMRFKHKKPIVNLPSVERPYGKQIRGVITARNEQELFFGSDMVSLEDTTKQHYMMFYDPEYVQEMRVPGFDAHCDIAKLANLMTEEEEEFYKWADKQETLTPEEKSRFGLIKRKRKKGKVVNFSGIYGAGPSKISVSSGLTLEESGVLHVIYWKRNKAVKLIAKDAVYKTVNRQFWLWNPVAKMWYYLKHIKDIFSTLNQGTGVYCFDVWIKEVRKRIPIQLQYHDEIGFSGLAQDRQEITNHLQKSIERANEILQLNVPLAVSVDIGKNYGEAH